MSIGLECQQHEENGKANQNEPACGVVFDRGDCCVGLLGARLGGRSASVAGRTFKSALANY